MQHNFDVEIAKEYGLKEAILIIHLWFWIEKNKANEVHYYDGTYWTYNSVRAFNKLFPYLSERQINNALKTLKDKEIIKTGNYNKSAYDRTMWYAFTKTGVSIMQKCKMEDAKMSNGYVENVKPIPDINTNIKPNIKPCKREYGEFKNVLLTDDEYKKLENANLILYIERLSSYIASTGKKYKSHYATILNWSRKDKTNFAYNNYHNKIPEWFNEDIEEQQVNDNEINKLEERLKKYK